jgi:hypothetical protein
VLSGIAPFASYQARPLGASALQSTCSQVGWWSEEAHRLVRRCVFPFAPTTAIAFATSVTYPAPPRTPVTNLRALVDCLIPVY